ncbi:MAG TPA: ComF family protein [Steroidobacter sp.]|nr:ComF family protein [Steroidobacter sp.]
MQYSQRLRRCQPSLDKKVDASEPPRRFDWLWPAVCILCGQRSRRAVDLCARCEADLILNEPACARCALPLPHADTSNVLCSACLRRPPHFHAAYAPFRYAYPIDRLVQRAKYQRDAPSGRVLGELLAARLRRRPSETLPQLLIPTPLSARRFRERGFNQAFEIALPIHAAIGVPLRPDLVERRRHTAEQSGLGRAERRRNLRGAFALLAPPPATHVVLVDDVITTASTANELTKVLLRAGVRKVEVWAVARTVGRG